MNILTHTLSGVAVGTVVASFSKSGFANKTKIILFSGFAGALPDIDAISLWSQFDSTIGEFFHLSTKGKDIYSAKFWYSHHGFMHSLFAGMLFAFFASLANYIIDIIFKKQKNFNLISSINDNKLIPIGFFLGFIIHLIEDMPTPASSWGGVNFFWPSRSYIGGTGDIWWWNNYDIFLIVLCVIVLNLFFMIISKFVSFSLKKATIIVFLLGFSSIFYQIKTRDFDFAYLGYLKNFQEYESKSKELQRDILGKKLYAIMEKFDNKLRIYF